MTPSGRRYQRAGGVALAACLAGAAGAAPVQDPQAQWQQRLEAVRAAAIAAQTLLPRPELPPAAVLGGAEAKAAGETVVALAEIHNRHTQTRFQFSANGWKIYATGGLDPTHPAGSYLVLQVEGRGAIVFDILWVLNNSNKPRPFAVNGVQLMLIGEPTFWSPERDSVLRIALNQGTMAEPEAGDSQLHFTVLDMKQGLFERGTPLNLGDEEFRLFYGDTVQRGEKRLQLGPGKGFAFVQRLAKDDFAPPVVLDDAKVEPGKPVSLRLSDATTIRLERGADDTLKIVQEDKK